MSDINDTIAEVLRLDEYATLGPWAMETEGANRPDVLVVRGSGARRVDPQMSTMFNSDAWWVVGPEARSQDRANADAALIAYYRDAAPTLARGIQGLQAEVKMLRERIGLREGRLWRCTHCGAVHPMSRKGHVYCNTGGIYCGDACADARTLQINMAAAARNRALEQKP